MKNIIMVGSIIKTPELSKLPNSDTAVITFTTVSGDKDKTSIFYNVSFFPSSEKSTEMFTSLEPGVILQFESVTLRKATFNEEKNSCNINLTARTINILGGGTKKTEEGNTPAATVNATRKPSKAAVQADPWDE